MEEANPMRHLVDVDFADWCGIGGRPAYISERSKAARLSGDED